MAMTRGRGVANCGEEGGADGVEQPEGYGDDRVAAGDVEHPSGVDREKQHPQAVEDAHDAQQGGKLWRPKKLPRAIQPKESKPRRRPVQR